jgi:hypothetical protein
MAHSTMQKKKMYEGNQLNIFILSSGKAASIRLHVSLKDAANKKFSAFFFFNIWGCVAKKRYIVKSA